MARQAQAQLKQAFDALPVKAAAPGEIISLAKASKYKAAEDIADRMGFSGKHRDQFIQQSVRLAEIKAAHEARKKPPMTQPSFTQWTPVGQQQQSGGLLFKGPSQK